jgi:hypothetical protein
MVFSSDVCFATGFSWSNVEEDMATEFNGNRPQLDPNHLSDLSADLLDTFIVEIYTYL